MWGEFLDSLDTPGGQLVVLLGLLGVSVAMWRIGFPEWDQLAGPVIGAILMRMTGMRNNAERKNGQGKPDKTRPLGLTL